MIRFLIPFTLIASQKLCTYSMCLVLEKQEKGKVMKCFLHSVQKIEKQGKEYTGNRLWRNAGRVFKDSITMIRYAFGYRNPPDCSEIFSVASHFPAFHSLGLDSDTLIVLLIVCPQITALKKMGLQG